MARKILTLTLVFIGTAMLIAGCEGNDSIRPTGKVKANSAYVKNFGQPPTPTKGTCFARVGFYPLRSEPGKVRAVPFFLFREAGQLQQLLDRLVSDDIVLPPGSDLINPFPPGTAVRVKRQTDNTVELDVALPKGPIDAQAFAAMASSLIETAAQFEGIERVDILLEDSFWPEMPSDGFRPDLERIGSVGPPALLMVVGGWGADGDGPEEILANFDRPVTVETFHLQDSTGKMVKGDYYRSVFDMSVVIHPDRPAELREGMVLRAEWEVTDRRGRKGKGSGEFVLKRHDHASQAVLPAPGGES